MTTRSKYSRKDQVLTLRSDVMYHRVTSSNPGRGVPRSEYIWVGDSYGVTVQSTRYITSWFLVSQRPRNQRPEQRREILLASGIWYVQSWRSGKYPLVYHCGITEEYAAAVREAFQHVRFIDLKTVPSFHFS
ncbi:unnamed protein product [Amoebophrya sp. A120]|nr:unnamed protein product [Amoebophrya sp. A120]|eukprot:GSA120T00021741001.1